MERRRCHGLMVKGRLYDYLENDGQFYVGAWKWVYRCVACGNISNSVMEQNQQMVGKGGTVDERTRDSYAMLEQPSIDEWITAILHERGAQTMDELASSLPALNWAQFFLAIDRLSRSAKIVLRRSQHRDYLLALNRGLNLAS
jgi:hypothetical protein